MSRCGLNFVRILIAIVSMVMLGQAQAVGTTTTTKSNSRPAIDAGLPDSAPTTFTLAAPGMADAAILVLTSSTVLRHGVGDFQEDAREALGRELPVASDTTNPRRALILVAILDCAGPLQQLVDAGKLDLTPCRGRWESYVICPLSNPFPGIDEALVIAGSDARGALYGLYELSETAFGTDPLKFWTDHVPPRISTAQWSRGRLLQGEPTFRFRGWYVNDENFLMGWKGAEDDIEPEVWAEIFETLLRLRGNLCSQVDYATAMKPETVKLLQERGLFLTGSHLDMLLSNPMRHWELYTRKIGRPGLPYSYITNADVMVEYWRLGAEAHRGENVLWPIGLRWTDDRDFFELDPSAPKDWPSRGQLVNRAIQAQLAILRRMSPKGEPPPVVFSMRGQAHLKAFSGGQLQLPPEAICLYNDKGSTAQFPPWPAEDLARHTSNGIYYHLTYCDNQWVQWVAPSWLAHELTRAVQAGMTQMAILNVGDIRETPLSLAAGMDFVYRSAPWVAAEAHANDFTREWSAFQYGPTAAEAIATLLNEYFALEHGTRASVVVEVFQTPLLGLWPKVFKNWNLERTFLSVARATAGDPDRLATELGGFDPSQEGLSPRFGQLGAGYLESVQGRWADLEQRATALQRSVPVSHQSFYYASVLLHIRSSRLASQFGLAMYQAIAATKARQFASAAEAFTQAGQFIQQIDVARQPATRGKWKDWYRGEEIRGWDTLAWGEHSSWSVHGDRAAAACNELAAICRHAAATQSSGPSTAR